MKKTFSLYSILILLMFSALSISSCRNHEDTVSCFPSVPINVTLDLNLAGYYDLQNTGGWMYIDELQSGTRGLIVVRTNNSNTPFLVFDRNAPHLCPDSNTTLEVKDGIKIICPKDGAEWMLLSGQPTAVANVPPKTYPAQYNSSTNTLQIYY